MATTETKHRYQFQLGIYHRIKDSTIHVFSFIQQIFIVYVCGRDRANLIVKSNINQIMTQVNVKLEL